MRRATILLALLVALVAVASHLPALRAGLVYDDREIVADNPLLRPAGADGWIDLLAAGWWWQGAGRDLLWRPLTLVSIALQLTAGAGPRGLHAGNLALHAAVAITLFALARRLCRRDGVALAAALLFAAHPLTVEAVSLVVGRADLLAALCSLGALLAAHGACALESGTAARRLRLAAAAGLAALAPLAKESGFVLPLLALLTLRPSLGAAPGTVRADRPRGRWPALAALALPAVGVLVLRVTVLGSLMRTAPPALGDNPIAHAPFWAGRLAALRLLAHGARLALWPTPLSADYSYAAVPVPPADAVALVSAAAGLAALALGLRLLARRPVALWGALFFLAAQILTANLLVPIGTIFGERLLYLPLAGLAVCAADLGAAASDGLRRAGPALLRRLAPAPPLIALLAVLTLGTASHVRAAIFESDLSLWQSTVAVVPDSARARYNLGRSLGAAGRHDEAAVQYRRALEILPDHLETLNNLATSELRLGRPDAALGLLDRAAALRPESATVALNRALALQRLGREEQARVAFRRGAGLDPTAARRLAESGEPWRTWLSDAAAPPPPPAPAGD